MDSFCNSAQHEFGSTPTTHSHLSHLLILCGACTPVHLRLVPSHKGGFKPDMAFDPSSTSVAQTTHLCCRLPGFNYKLTKKFKFDVDGWVERSRKRWGEKGGETWNIAVGSGRPVYWTSARRAGSVTQAESGLLSEALNFKERNSSLPCSGPLLAGTTRKEIQGEERGNDGIPDRTMWDKDRTILRRHEKKSKHRALLETGITVNGHANGPPGSGFEGGDR